MCKQRAGLASVKDVERDHVALHPNRPTRRHPDRVFPAQTRYSTPLNPKPGNLAEPRYVGRSAAEGRAEVLQQRLGGKWGGEVVHVTSSP